MNSQKPSSNPGLLNRIRIVFSLFASTAAIIVLFIEPRFRLAGFILLLIAFTAVVWPYLKKALDRILNPKSALTWYHVREDATPDMKKQMKESSILVFIGISQKSLIHYLHECLQESKNPVPWKSIKIFFADEGIGQSFEKVQFEQSLRNSRQKISELLTSRIQAKKLSEFTEITFKQAKQPLTYGGSIFGNNLSDIEQEENFHTIYVVYYLPSPPSNTKNSLTLKIRSDSKTSRNSDAITLSKTYIDTYKFLSQTAKKLGTFKRSLWDWSATEWFDFCQEYQGMSISMSKLIELAHIQGNEHILDVAAGTGNTTKLLREKNQSGRLTVLDGSPGMLQLAKKTLGSNGQVDYALCCLPASEGHDIDIRNKKFDMIFCHLALFAFAKKMDNIEAFAAWCAHYLKPKGKVFLNAHNSVLSVEPGDTSDNWRDWEDPLKKKLVEIASERGLDEYLRIRPAENFFKPKNHRQDLISRQDIKKAFENAGFEMLQQMQNIIQIRMQDRIRMWRVPAILDTFIDINKIGIVKGQDIVNSAGESKDVVGKLTKPRTVTSWAFRLKSKA